MTDQPKADSTHTFALDSYESRAANDVNSRVHTIMCLIGERNMVGSRIMAAEMTMAIMLGAVSGIAVWAAQGVIVAEGTPPPGTPTPEEWLAKQLADQFVSAYRQTRADEVACIAAQAAGEVKQ